MFVYLMLKFKNTSLITAFHIIPFKTLQLSTPKGPFQTMFLRQFYSEVILHVQWNDAEFLMSFDGIPGYLSCYCGSSLSFSTCSSTRLNIFFESRRADMVYSTKEVLSLMEVSP